jgi:hypothetical protein
VLEEREVIVMSEDALEIPVVRIQQQGKTIYVGKMSGCDILDGCITTE